MAVISIYKNYNNYFNRTIKTDDLPVQSYYTAENTNFNPNDWVNTNIVIGDNQKPYDGQGDYVKVVDGDITSHWFLMEAVRLRNGQYRLSLRRDVLRDYNNQVLSSTAKIKRGIVNDRSAFIYNDEPMSLNRIKRNEIELKDGSNTAWICGFIARDSEATECNISTTVIPDFTEETFNNSGYNAYLSPIEYINYDSNISLAYTEEVYNNYIPRSIYNWTELKNGLPGVFYYDSFIVANKQAFRNYLASKARILGTYWSTKSFDYIGIQSINDANNDIRTIRSLKGKYLTKTENNVLKYYKINVIESQQEEKTGIISQASPDDTGSSSFFSFLLQTLQEYDATIRSNQIKLQASYTKYSIKIELEEVNEGTYKIDIPSRTDRIINKDAPFDLFCMPYSDNLKVKQGNNSTNSNKQFAIQIAGEIARELGANCYDIQLLPYCPMTGYNYDSVNNEFNINSSDPKRYTGVYRTADGNITGDPVAYIFWSASTSGSFDINFDDSILNKDSLKVINQCDVLRLTSPNYNGQFEFSLAKNGGSLPYFNVDYTYLPYSSYIHVNPAFSGLYGQDFNDARGLIAQGDFSITYLSDAWVNYQINNKNYNNIFNRQIENMDVNRRYEIINQAAGALSGSIGAGVGAGILGGGILGGIAGGISAAAGAADLYISDRLYEEKKDYTRDMFAYQLDNVKALPNSIAKTTAYTENNKIFPVLEVFTCTSEERIAFAKFIVNYSMNIGVVGNPINYMFEEYIMNVEDEEFITRGFISAELIYIEDLGEDYHVINAIANEMSKGWYQK